MRLFTKLAVLSAIAVSAQPALSKDTTPLATQISDWPPTVTINGKTPPGKLERLHKTSVMIDTIQTDGNRLYVTRGTRKPGTRVGIHIHAYGGHTCVMSGAITDFVEGHAPGYFPAGTCYYMPPNTPMTAANLGTVDAVLVDTFVLPEGVSPMTVLEPGYPAGLHD